MGLFSLVSCTFSPDWIFIVNPYWSAFFTSSFCSSPGNIKLLTRQTRKNDQTSCPEYKRLILSCYSPPVSAFSMSFITGQSDSFKWNRINLIAVHTEFMRIFSSFNELSLPEAESCSTGNLTKHASCVVTALSPDRAVSSIWKWILKWIFQQFDASFRLIEKKK